VATDGSLLVTDIGNSGVYRVEPLVVENLEAVQFTETTRPAGSASPEASPLP